MKNFENVERATEKLLRNILDSTMACSAHILEMVCFDVNGNVGAIPNTFYNDNGDRVRIDNPILIDLGAKRYYIAVSFDYIGIYTPDRDNCIFNCVDILTLEDFKNETSLSMALVTAILTSVYRR